MIMKKKQYIFPLVDVTLLRTRELMSFTDSVSGGGTPSENFGGGSGAPRKRWTDVF